MGIHSPRPSPQLFEALPYGRGLAARSDADGTSALRAWVWARSREPSTSRQPPVWRYLWVRDGSAGIPARTDGLGTSLPASPATRRLQPPRAATGCPSNSWRRDFRAVAGSAIRQPREAPRCGQGCPHYRSGRGWVDAVVLDELREHAPTAGTSDRTDRACRPRDSHRLRCNRRCAVADSWSRPAPGSGRP